MTEGTESPNQESTWMPREKEDDEYLETLEADTIKQTDMKEKLRNEYHRRTRKLLERPNSAAEITSKE